MTDTAALDAWLAEHLLGWTSCNDQTHRYLEHWHAPGERLSVRCPPALSTTGDGMLMVLEAMRERRWFYFMWAEGIPPHRIAAAFATVEEGWRDREVEADTLPLAVALAARAALEAEA